MIKYVAVASLVAASLSAQGDDGSLESVLMDENAGCMTGPMEQFGRYIGDWDIADLRLSQDGTTWSKGNGARWNFTCVGNGIAVQDFWMPNGPEGSPPPGVGTNLRIYDAATDSWNVAWTATGSPGFTHITAKEDKGGNIVMHWVTPVQDPPLRITFVKPTQDGWDWVFEVSQDAGETWTAVTKFTATRRMGSAD